MPGLFEGRRRGEPCAPISRGCRCAARGPVPCTARRFASSPPPRPSDLWSDSPSAPGVPRSLLESMDWSRDSTSALGCAMSSCAHVPPCRRAPASCSTTPTTSSVCRGPGRPCVRPVYLAGAAGEHLVDEVEHGRRRGCRRRRARLEDRCGVRLAVEVAYARVFCCGGWSTAVPGACPA